MRIGSGWAVFVVCFSGFEGVLERFLARVGCGGAVFVVCFSVFEGVLERFLARTGSGGAILKAFWRGSGQELGPAGPCLWCV